MDPSKATAALATVGAAGKKAGDAVDAGARKGRKGLDGLDAGANSAASSLLSLTKAQMGLSALKAAGAAIGDEFKRSADYIKTLANEFADLRKAMQELAALRGEQNNNRFAVKEAQEGQKYGLSPEENRRFQSEFMNFAGSQVGTDKETGGVAKGAKLTEEQGKEFSGRIAAMMKTVGVDPALGAQLGGAMLQNAKGPQDVEKLMRDFAETFALAQKGPVPLGQMLPQMSRLMAYDMSAQDAAKMFNVVAPAAPGEEGTSAEAAISAIQKMKNEGKGEQFGVKRGMTDIEAVKAFGENITDRKKKLMAGGMDEKTAMDELQAMLAEQEVVADKREARGLVRGFAQQGVEKEGFKQYEEIHKNVPVDFEQAEIKKYQESDQGKAEAAAIDKSVARVEKGAEEQPVRTELEKGEARLTREGKLGKSRLGNIGRGSVGIFTGVSAEQQQINEETISELRKRAGVNTNDQGVGPDGKPLVKASDVGYRSQESVNAEIKELLQKIAESNQKIADAAKPEAGKGPAPAPAAKPAAGPGKPLAAPPPPGAGARQ